MVILEPERDNNRWASFFTWLRANAPSVDFEIPDDPPVEDKDIFG